MIRGIIFDFNRTLYDPDLDELIPGAIPLLDSLKSKGYKMCLISKKNREDRREQISKLGLDKYFIDIQVIEEETKDEKSFERCFDIMGFDNSDIAVVGDRIRSEITLGNKLGMVTVWYKAGKFASEAPRNYKEIPRYTITQLEELKSFLR